MKKTNLSYCLTEDGKVFLCMEGFFCAIRDEFEKMCGGRYVLEFSIRRKE